MKKLLVKAVVLLVLIVGCNLLINHFFYNRKLPYYWGSKDILDKRNYLVKNRSKINTLFIGSSKTHYQIIPALFDSLANSSCNCDIHSYNFGIDGMLPPESFYMYRSLLQNDSLSVKTVFLEFDFIKSAAFKNIETWREYYWINNETYREYANSYLDSKYTIGLKSWNIAALNFMTAEKAFNIGKFNEYVAYKKNADSVENDNKLNGFSPLVHHPKISEKEKVEMKNVENSSRLAYSHKQKWIAESKNKTFYKLLNEIVTLSNKKGIRLVLLFPPQWKVYQYRELFPILNAIPEKNKILLADYNSHKSFFDPDLLFDADHLDGTGAKLYTNELANAFIKIR